MRALLVAPLLIWAAACGDDTTDADGSGGNTTTDGGAGAGGATEGGSGAGGSAPDHDFVVMTWNLEQYPKTAETPEIVAQVLDQERPDVIGLQELDLGTDFEELDEALPNYDGIVTQLSDGFSRVGLLYNTERVSVEDAQMLFADDEYAFPRPMLLAHVVSKTDPSKDFLFGVVHLKAQLDSESIARRRAACDKLDAWLDEQVLRGDEKDIVVVGDFNDELTDPRQFNVFGPLLQVADGGFLTLPLEQRGQYTYIPFDSFIDHVHVRGASLFANSVARVLTLDETIDDYVDRTSDHRPVVVTLDLQP